MGIFHLEAAADHVEGLAHENDIVRAVLELVWNALDADSDRVEVIFRRNEADGIDGVAVKDDGHGMSPEAAQSAFRWIGGSWKRAARRSQGKNRPLHGKSGQGRLRAFALGSEVRWTSVAEDTAKNRVRTVVRANSASRNDFEITDPVSSSAERGTQFEAAGKSGLDRLETEETRAKVISVLAPYLISHPSIEVIYDGKALNPSANIDGDTIYELAWNHQGTIQSAKLRIIEWVQASIRTVQLCDADGVTVDEIDSPPAADFKYSAYVMWESMPEHQGEWLLTKLEEEESLVGGLVKAAERKLIEHFEDRRSQRRRELVEEWKSDKTYPYLGEPGSEEEKVERATFDVVATSIRRHVPKTKKQQKLTLGLLKQSLQQRPDDVSALLDQFLGLPAEEREQLDRLLKRTSLSRLYRRQPA
jgi:hypothetical protein